MAIPSTDIPSDLILPRSSTHCPPVRRGSYTIEVHKVERQGDGRKWREPSVSMGNLATLLHCFSLPFKRKMSQNESTVSDKETMADKEVTADNDSGYVEGDARDSGVLDVLVSALRNRIQSKKEITYGKTYFDLPCRAVVQMTTHVLAADTGPEGGIQCLSVAKKGHFNQFHGNPPVSNKPIAGIPNWKMHHHRAYGLSQSMYDFDPDTQKLSGEPNADAFAVVARENNAFLAVADGVNWGEKPFMAARSAVKGCIEYLSDHLHEASTTPEVAKFMLKSFQHAQSCIIDCQGTLTTLCAAVVCKLQDINGYGLCVVNVGDSLAYVYRKKNCVQEVTIGSHADEACRDMRNTGGCLGPSDGHNPDLTNLTCSFTLVDEGDIVFLTTDGISDNFDPVVLKSTREEVEQLINPVQNSQSDESLLRSSAANLELSRRRSQSEPVDRKLRSSSFKGHMLTKQVRRNYACKLMKQKIELESPSGEERSAKELCANLISFVVNKTREKREILENAEISDRQKRYLQSKMKPGKLDHATVAAYEVGHFRPEPLKLTFQGKSAVIPVESSEATPLFCLLK